MIIQCPKCNQTFLSDKKYNVHLALDHEAFENGDSISRATLASLDKTIDQVHLFLLKFPQCRSIKDTSLWAKYTQYYGVKANINGKLQHLIVWDSNDQLYEPLNKKGWTELEYRAIFQHSKSVERCRRKLQRKDRMQWHDKEGHSLGEHHCILPSEVRQAQAIQLEATYRDWSVK